MTVDDTAARRLAGLVLAAFEQNDRLAMELFGGNAAALLAQDVRTARGPWGSEPQPRITTPCPACGRQSLFIGSGGGLTCAILECSQPSVQVAISVLTHAAGAMAMAVLQDDLAGAKVFAQHVRVDFDEDGPFVRWRR